MRKLLAALTVLVATIAWADFHNGDITAAETQLVTDVQARIAAIGTPVPKADANEATNLKLAAKQLAKYTGVENVAGLKILAKAGKFLALSRTQDPAIAAD